MINYMAGLFDGEGSFSIRISIRKSKTKDSLFIFPRLSISLKYGWQVLECFKEEFGGNIYHYKDGVHRWQINKVSLCYNAAMKLAPHLIIKKSIAIMFLEALRKYPGYDCGFKHHNKRWNRADVIEVAKIGMNLNPHRAKSKSHQQKIISKLEDIYVE